MARKRHPDQKRSQKIEDEILRRLVEGESLRQICFDDYMPEKGTILGWCQSDEVWREKYQDARRWGIEYHADEILHIAEQCKPTPGDVQKAKLQIDAIKWVSSKLLPGVYGDVVRLKHSQEKSHEEALKELDE